jgi:hypothetical protein
LHLLHWFDSYTLIDSRRVLELDTLGPLLTKRFGGCQLDDLFVKDKLIEDNMQWKAHITNYYKRFSGR